MSPPCHPHPNPLPEGEGTDCAQGQTERGPAFLPLPEGEGTDCAQGQIERGPAFPPLPEGEGRGEGHTNALRHLRQLKHPVRVDL